MLILFILKNRIKQIEVYTKAYVPHQTEAGTRRCSI